MKPAAFLLGILVAATHVGGEEMESRSVVLGGGVSLELVKLPPGEFLMGSTAEEKTWATGIEGGATPGTARESFEGEAPRPMRVKEAFWMGRTEVSMGQFRRFVEESGYVSDAERPGGAPHCFDPEWTGYHFTTETVHPWKASAGKSWRDPGFPNPLREDYPVVCVSWNDARAFGEWLTRRESEAGRLPDGLVFRFPTEAEWEYACREGRSTGTKPAFANLDDIAWFADNSRGNTHPVGSRVGREHHFGLSDIHGNVAEWCWDWSGTFQEEKIKDPKGPGSGLYRIFRGGSWADPERCCRAAYRGPFSPVAPESCLVGFRPVCGRDPAAETGKR